MDSLVFIQQFLTINTISLGSITGVKISKQRELLTELDGHSREPASLINFSYYYRDIYGCIYTTKCCDYLISYKKYYTPVIKAEKNYRSIKPEYTSAFTTEALLKKYKQYIYK